MEVVGSNCSGGQRDCIKKLGLRLEGVFGNFGKRCVRGKKMNQHKAGLKFLSWQQEDSIISKMKSQPRIV